MKLRLDVSRCSGYGICAELCPSLFRIDDAGYSVLLNEGMVATGEEEGALMAVQSCAQQAIAVDGPET